MDFSLRGTSRTADSILFVGLLLFANFCLSSLIPAEFTLATTPDSLAYMDAAMNIRNGHGMSLTNYVHGAENPYVPITTWPPLYSLYLSVFPGAGENIFLSTYLAAIPILALNCFLVFLLARRVMHPVLALSAVALFAVSSGNQIITAYVWSEPLFITTLLLATYSSFKAHEAEASGDYKLMTLWLVIAGVALAGSFYTRYIGFLFAFLIPLSWLFTSSLKRSFPGHLSGVLVYMAVSGALVLRNYFLGDITGGDIYDAPRRASEEGVLENTLAVLDSLYLLIPDNLLLVASCLVAGVLISVSSLRFEGKIPAVFNTDGSSPFYTVTIVSMGVLYLLGLIVLRSIVTFEEIRIRYIAVSAPFFSIMLFYMLVTPVKRRIIHVMTRGISISLIVLVFIQAGLIFNSASQKRTTLGQPNYPLTQSGERSFYSDLTSPGQVFGILSLAEGMGLEDTDVVITERPEVFAVITNRKFRRLAGGITPESLDWLAAQNDKGFLFLLESGSIAIVSEFLGIDPEEVNQPYLIIPLPLKRLVDVP